MKSSLALIALSFAVTLSLAPKVSAASGGAKADRPNILYFYVDDMGWGSIGPNGQAERRKKGLPYVRTPNLDRLAEGGINFRRGYGCHVCSPARSSQQTGFHQGHTFADRNDPDNAKKAMRADDITMGDALSKAGYVTGYWGKWGYGGSKDMQNPTIDNVQTLPTSHGYQHVLAELHHVRAHTFFQPTLWHAPAPRGSVGGLHLLPNSMAQYRSKHYPATPALQNHAKYPKTAYCDDLYAFHALDFVRAHGQNYNKTKQPFFGLLAVQIPHAPFGEIAKLPDWDKAYAKDPKFKSLAAQTRQWAAMVTRIDAHFGNIMDALEDPNNDGDKSDSIAGNTLVIFQSDNGGPRGANNSELDANGGLSGSKGSIQEGGIRVPLVMRWPAKITKKSKLKAGTNTNMVVDVTDLLPTFCDLAGAPTPLGIDGVSIAPTLTGEGHQRHREFIIHEAGNGKSIIRGKYKLVRGNAKTSAPAKSKGTKRKKKNTRQVSGTRLYDLEADHAEKNNIASKHPELVKELDELLTGERVDEPKGFANTYHNWTGTPGKDNAGTSKAENWSDYVYANAGITYSTDKGAPQLSWVARINNDGGSRKTANIGDNLEVLALEVTGTQTVAVGPNKSVTGRNEIRIASGGTVTLEAGRVSSLRWVDVQPSGTLSGSGLIKATVYNKGTVASSEVLKVHSDYHQSSQGSLNVNLDGNRDTPVIVKGDASLSGKLVVDSKSAGTHTILTASKITGRFDEVTTADGKPLKVKYTKTAVTVTTK